MQRNVPLILKKIFVISSLYLAFFFGADALGRIYTTNFPNTENPIGENGNWVTGQSAGGNLWGDIRTTAEFAFGVNQPTKYGDPTAIVRGVWGPNQTAQATVKVNITPSRSVWPEAEVRLRTTIGSSSITGYEVYCSTSPGNPYCHIASWGGPNGVWVNMDESSPSIYLKDGDVLKGTVTGVNPVTITMFINGTHVLTVKDSGTYKFTDGKRYGPWTGGNPGIGFCGTSKINWNNFGFSGFIASDGDTVIIAAPTSPPRNLHIKRKTMEVENPKKN